MAPDHAASDAPGSNANSFLNDHQRRHFDVFLAMLEQALFKIEDLVHRSNLDAARSLTIYNRDLPSGFAESAAPVLQSIRDQVAGLGKVLGIQQQHRSTGRAVRAILTAELVRLDDSYARRLGGYGAVDPRVQTTVDPNLDEIRTSLVALLDALGSTTHRGRAKR